MSEEDLKNASPPTGGEPAPPAEDSSWGSRQKLMIALNVAVMVLLAGGIFVGINYIGALNYFRQDWTAERLYTLSPETVSLLENLSQDVEIFNYYRLTKGGQIPPRVQIQVREKVEELLTEYKQHTSRLVVRDIDVDRDAAEAKLLQSELEIDEANVTVFRVGKGASARRKVIKLTDVAVVRGGVNQASLRKEPARMVAFRGEEQFTSAIRSVLEEKPTRLYFTTGHGEMSPDDFSQQRGYSQVARALRQNNYRIDLVKLLEKGSVPGDCDGLVIAGPTQDFTDGEIHAIREYLGLSGNLFILLRELSSTNILDAVEDFGVSALPPNVIAQDSVDAVSRDDQFVLLVSNGLSRVHDTTRALAEAGLSVILPMVRPLTIRQVKGVSMVKTLQTFGSTSWGERVVDGKPNMRKDPEETPGPLTLGVALEKTQDDGAKSRVLVLGDSDFASNAAFKAVNNRDLALNCFDWLVDKGLYYEIAPKVPASRLVQISQETASAYNWIWWGMPIFFGAVLGCLVWWSRSR